MRTIWTILYNECDFQLKNDVDREPSTVYTDDKPLEARSDF